MKILVTGGAGYIGSHLAHEACARGYDVTILDNLSQGHKSALPKTARFIEADVADEQVLTQIFGNGIDAVFHFAAFTRVAESIQEPLKYYENNTVKSSKLIAECVKNKVKYFIFSSTAAVYGNSETIAVPEEAPLNPISPYGKSKLMTEQILKDVSLDKMKFVILRYFNVAGASLKYPIGQSTAGATHLIKAAAEVATGKRNIFELFGSDYNTPDGTCIRDYIHVDDLVEAHMQGLEYLKNNGENNIFNCGYQRGYSVKEVVDAMKKVSNKNFETKVLPRRPGDIEQLIADNQKIKRVLNFKPKCDDLNLICKSAYDWELKTKET